MSYKDRDRKFRTPKITYVDFNHIEMDRVLTLLFPRLKYDGYPSKLPPRSADLTVNGCKREFIKNREWFVGFEHFPSVLYHWIETDLMDVVNRGKPNQAVAAPRPLHGNTYKFRNKNHTRDYGAAEQIYWMLFNARKGQGQEVLGALKSFFFKGIDLETDRYDPTATVDVETQAILRLDPNEHSDARDTKDYSREPSRIQPLYIGQADIMADDILRLLAYEPYMPRSVLVEYLKTLMAFHMALYHLRLLQVLPKMVKRHSGGEASVADEADEHENNSSRDSTSADAREDVALVVEMGDANNPHMAELASKSGEGFYSKIPAFIQASFIVKKLDELAEYIRLNIGNPTAHDTSEYSVDELISLLKPEHDAERQTYFKSRLAGLKESLTAGNEIIDPEIQKVTAMGIGDFESFIEILMAYRGKYLRGAIVKCLDSFLLKNKETGLLAQAPARGSPRRFVLGSKLLEVLVQVAVLTRKDGRFVTHEIRIEELLTLLRERYGLHIDQLPKKAQHNSSVQDRQALRLNLEAFKRRLREIGFYEDLSDAYVTQKVSPRYTIEENNDNHNQGRQE